MEHNGTSGIDAVIEKIKKVLRLANKAGTEGEREAAELAAKRLADANGISLASIHVSDSEAKGTMKQSERDWKRSGKEVHYICQTIRKHFGVVVMQSFRRGSSKMKLTFFGCAVNIAIAEYVYEILWRESNRAYDKARAEICKEFDAAMGAFLDRDAAGRVKRPSTLLKKDSFMAGWFLQIDRKLTERPLRNDDVQFAEEKRAAERAFEKFKDNNGENVKTNCVTPNKSDREAMVRGYSAAANVNLSRPCEGRDGGTSYLGHTLMLERRAS